MDTNRYRRQILVKQYGPKGQQLLSTKKAVIIGAGGLGSNCAELLTRTGIGAITIYDHDTIQLSNLHRTALYTEADVGKPKVTILKEHLHHINHQVSIEALQQKVTKNNIHTVVKDADILLDGTDTLPLRFLLNDIAIQQQIPWVYAGIYATVGMTMGIIPTKTPCLRCISHSIPKEKQTETPVLSTLPRTIAAIQTMEALKILLKNTPTGFIIYDTWTQHFDVITMERNPTCTCCTKHNFECL
jgi:molybdopterin/thiamine biosynthesis adenylyltransferase